MKNRTCCYDFRQRAADSEGKSCRWQLDNRTNSGLALHKRDEQDRRRENGPGELVLIIRQEQMETFAAAEMQKFKDKMVAHLQKHFPKQCEVLGPEGRDWVQYGFERAACYGLVAERDVCKYIGVMLAFGRDFDKDSRLPWASAALNAT